MIWDPNAFTFTGQPLAPRSPAALRVLGAQATPTQRAMAQAAFSAFCTNSRLSSAPNPVENGRLPDGSVYKIQTVGPQTIMTLWPVGEEDTVRGGIGIVLTDLAGGLLPGHILVGEGGEEQAQPYILTPVEKKGTRTSTGKWKVRKAAFNGGKASFYHPKSGKYLIGMDGTPDLLLPPPPFGADMAGVNTRANRIGFRIDGTSFYAGKRENAAGVFRSEYDILPFFRRNVAGQLCWVQIVPEFLFGTRLKMFAGLYEPAPAAYVGELVDTYEMPEDYSLNYQTISPSPDGNTLRMVFRRASNNAFVAVDMSVSDGSLAVTSMVEYQAIIPGSAGSNTTGTLPTGQTTTGFAYGGQSAGLEYGYDGKGLPVVVRPGTAFGDLDYTLFQQSTDSFVGDIRTSVDITNGNESRLNPSSFMSVNGVSTSFPRPPESLASTRTITTVTNTTTNVVISQDAAGSTFIDRKEYIALYPLISEPTVGFVVQVVLERHFTQASHPEASFDGTNWIIETVIDSETEVYTGRLQVMAKGAVVDDIEVDQDNVGNFSATIAADPVTGAICCNVLEFTGEDRAAVAHSWIYVADDTGGKRLSQIMAVADSRDIRIRNDSSLLSV